MMIRALLLTLASLLPVLSGCAALVIGGAAAGGYAVGSDERRAGQIFDDGTITAAVKSRLIADKYVKAGDINVDTHEGVVTLNGSTRSYLARTQAEDIARSVKGVREVVNKLEVVVDP